MIRKECIREGRYDFMQLSIRINGLTYTYMLRKLF